MDAVLTGATTITAATLDLGTATRIFNILAGKILDINAAIANWAVTKAGTGTLRYSGRPPTSYAGDTYVDAGTLELNKTAVNGAIAGNLSIGSGTVRLLHADQIDNASEVSIAASGALDLNGFDDGFDALSGSGTVANDGTGPATLTIGLADTVGGADFAGSLQDGTGTLALIKDGAGIQTLSGVSTYTGPTDIANGTLQLGVSDALTSTNDVTVDGTLDLAGFDLTIDELSGSGVVTSSGGASTLTVGNNDGSADFTGIIQNGAGSIALIKTGLGTQTLSSTNSYTGATTISAGNLQITGSLAAGSAVDVQSGGTLSGGSTVPGAGTVNGAVTVEGGGIVAPSVLGGTLSVGSITFNSSSALDIQIDGGGNFGALDVLSGTVDVTGATLNLSGPYQFTPGPGLLIVNAASVTGPFASAPDFFNLQPIAISYTGGITVSYDATPVIDAGSGNDNIKVYRSGANTVVEINSVVVMDTPEASLNTLTIDGGAGDDTLTVDRSGGDPIPAGGLSFNGGPQATSGDALVVTGGTIGALGYTTINGPNPNAGTLNIDSSTIHFTGLEPVTVTPAAGTVTITVDNGVVGGAAITTDIVNDVPGMMRVDVSGFPAESMTFGVPTRELVVNGDTNTDNTININSVDPTFAAALTINAGGSGTDQVNLNTDLSLVGDNSAPAVRALTISADEANLNGDLTTSGAAGIAADVQINAVSINIGSLLAIDTTGGAVAGSLALNGNVNLGTATSINLVNGLLAGSLTLGGDLTMNSLLDGTSTITAASVDLGSTSRTFTIDTSKTLDIDAAITGTGTDLNKLGGGTLRFSGPTANTYTGITNVKDGTLELNKSASTNAIAGNLYIGDGVGSLGSAIVRLDNAEQINNLSLVQLDNDGLLDLNGYNETINFLFAADWHRHHQQQLHDGQRPVHAHGQHRHLRRRDRGRHRQHSCSHQGGCRPPQSLRLTCQHLHRRHQRRERHAATEQDRRQRHHR